MSYDPELQELFLTSLKHICRQGKPSGVPRTHGFSCKYRGPDGSSCAAAPFILAYDEGMEQTNFHGVVRDFTKNIDPVAAKHAFFVDSLQSAHDDAAEYTVHSPEYFIREFQKRMTRVAWRHELVVPPRIAMGARTY